MILKGNQRGGARNLAIHLTKPENDRVEIHELRGFVAHDLDGAFRESYAMSRATKCKQHLYSLSLNPPQDEDVSKDVFENAVNRAEKRLGLEGQPRAIVFHEKNGRRHAHAVWCRIDMENVKAVQLSHDQRKLNDLARDLYLEHGWTMPHGFVRYEDADPRNYSLAEWQQAKRAKHDPAKTKALFQDAWTISDGKTAFAHALKERGYILAKGDRRGHVAVDRNGEAFAISRWTGLKAKQVRDKLGKPDDLPNVSAAHDQAAKLVTERLEELLQQNQKQAQERLDRLEAEKQLQIRKQRLERQRLKEQQVARLREEQIERDKRVRKGLRGLLDYLTGKRRRIENENREAAALAKVRDQAQRERLSTAQSKAGQTIENKQLKTAFNRDAIDKELRGDAQNLRDTAAKAREERKAAFKQKRQRSSDRPRRRRSRDGPEPGL